MKKQIFSAALLFAAAATLLVSCAKDETAPVVTPKDGTTSSFDLGAAVDPGATANDDKDGDISASVTSDFATVVKKNEVNTYTVNYKVADKAGNEGTATRTVKVKSDKLAGTYSVADVVSGGTDPGTYNYTVTITQSSTDYNKLNISNFLGLGATVQGNILAQGAAINIPSQTITTVNGSFTISGTGQYDGATFKITKLTYSAGAELGSGDATFTKQ